MLVFARGQGAEQPPKRVQLGFQHPPVGELQQADTVGGRPGDERAERALDPREPNEVGRAAVARWPAEELAERRPEAAERVVAVAGGDAVERLAGAELFQGAAEPAGPAEALERDTKLPQ